MDVIVEEHVNPEDLKKFEKTYRDQELRGKPSDKAMFDYAWCLVRSKYLQDMQKGVALLEELFRKTKDEVAKRDYLYYMSIAYTRIKEYDTALKYANAIRKIEPGNKQAVQLEDYIKKKMKKEGLMGIAIVGGAALALGGIVGLGLAALSKK
ncbi:mitochondrial fission 1 protein [Patella vulgata]|uniref:mitochondrial fission 1 protein n=1 Tax=Patella vulgata TaxID=6465 RepID=UPI00218081B4|nr:mitochondrial fission 1 protein [Patella vulgata]